MNSLIFATLWIVFVCVLFFFDRASDGRKPKKFEISVLTAALLFLAILLIVAKPILATVIAIVVAVMIGTASRIKYSYTLHNLTIHDVTSGLGQGGVAFVAKTFPGMTKGFLLMVAAGAVVVLAAAGVIDENPVSRTSSIALMAVVAVLLAIALLLRGPLEIGRTYLQGQNLGHFIGFMSSIAVAIIMRFRPLRMANVSNEAADLPPGKPAGIRPHVILIHHESVFDPAIYDLPVTPSVAQFLRPENGISGRLHVDIFGGGSWMSEFAIQTGLSAKCFGEAGRHIFHFGEGKFRHTLSFYLGRLGYATTYACTITRNFLNYEPFFKSIGTQNVLFADDYAPQYRTADLTDAHSDEALYAAVSDWLGRNRSPQTPVFLTISTNFNHAPHTHRALPEKQDAAAYDFALDQLGSPEYAEYFARLDFSARSYAAFRQAVSTLLDNEPVLFIRYGDHQPAFVADVGAITDTPSFEEKRFQTFYAIEAMGIELDMTSRPGCDPLDAAFLGTVALAAAGMPVEGLHRLHHDLIGECGAGYFNAPSPAKGRYHRLLIDKGLIHAQH